MPPERIAIWSKKQVPAEGNTDFSLEIHTFFNDY